MDLHHPETTAERGRSVLVKAAILAGIATSALSLAGCSPVSAEGPTPSATHSAEVEKDLTCEEFAATLEIPTVDSEEGKQFIAAHRISGEVPADQVVDKVADLTIEWETSTIEYLPTDSATQLDCLDKAGSDHKKLGAMLGLDRLSDLYAESFISPSVAPEKKAELRDALQNTSEQVAFQHLQNLYLKPNSTTDAVVKSDPSKRESVVASENEVDTSIVVPINIGGRIDTEVSTGGRWQRNADANAWLWVAAS